MIFDNENILSILKEINEEANSDFKKISFERKSEITSPMEVILKPEMLDTSALGVANTEKLLWRPSNFNEYIGQSKLKDILTGYITGCKAMKKPFPHTMIDGKAGTGKTTVCYILANILGLNFVETVATTIKSSQQFVDLLVKVDGGILFIDEIHMINKQVANFILPLLEDFQINGQRIKPFTLMCATSEKGVLLRKFKPLVDRMKIQKTLDDYTPEELLKLIEQFKEKSFKDSAISPHVFCMIVKNCRNTPRIAIRYLESYIYMGKSIEEILKGYDIVKDGVTLTDIKVLKLLSQNPNGVGLKAISSYLAMSEENYLYQFEGYLLEKGLITIGSRRVITNTGKQFLKEI